MAAVATHTHTHSRAHTHIHTRTRTHTHTHTHARAHAHTHTTHTHTHTHTLTRAHTHTHTHTHAHTHTHTTHTRARAHAHTHAHPHSTHTHTRTHTHGFLSSANGARSTAKHIPSTLSAPPPALVALAASARPHVAGAPARACWRATTQTSHPPTHPRRVGVHASKCNARVGVGYPDSVEPEVFEPPPAARPALRWMGRARSKARAKKKKTLGPRLFLPRMCTQRFHFVSPRRFFGGGGRVGLGRVSLRETAQGGVLADSISSAFRGGFRVLNMKRTRIFKKNRGAAARALPAAVDIDAALPRCVGARPRRPLPSAGPSSDAAGCWPPPLSWPGRGSAVATSGRVAAAGSQARGCAAGGPVALSPSGPGRAPRWGRCHSARTAHPAPRPPPGCPAGNLWLPEAARWVHRRCSRCSDSLAVASLACDTLLLAGAAGS